MKNTYVINLLVVLLVSNIFAQWESRTNGLPDDWSIGLAIDACDEQTAVISLRKSEHPEQIFITNDAGLNWIDITPFTDPFDEGTDISIIDKNNIWVTASGRSGDTSRILHTSDGGLNWEVQFIDTTMTKFFNYIEMFDLQNGIAMGDGENDSNVPFFIKTHDGGLTWSSVNDSAIGGYSGDTWRRLDFVNTEVGYFNVSGIESPRRIHKTENGCSDWELLDYPHGITSLKFYNEQIGLVSHFESDSSSPGSFIDIFGRTFDGGNTWELFEVDSVGWGNDFEFLPNDPSQVWFVDGWGHGLFYSSDTGRTWTKFDYSDIELAGRDIVFVDDKHGWILGDNGTLLYTENNGGLLTDVIETNENRIPKDFKLEQNYPNPFNPTTTIKYSISAKMKSQKSNVVLIVYDVIGKEVAELVNENKSPGNYEVNFDASDLASGIYYYQLVIGDFIQIKKMILLK